MLEGGLTDGQRRRSGVRDHTVATATAAAGTPARQRTVATDGGQSAQPQNVVQGALAGTSYTHDDAVVLMTFISTLAILTWLVLEVSD
jgi:hypothetical protein